MDRIKPWMVALALALAGLAGAGVVYAAARAQHRRDRETIVRWDRAHLAVEQRAADTFGRLPLLATLFARGNAVRAQLEAARGVFEQARTELPALPSPAIAQPAVAELVAAIEASLRALAVLEGERNGDGVLSDSDVRRFKQRWDAALPRWTEGREQLQLLHARVKLPPPR